VAGELEDGPGWIVGVRGLQQGRPAPVGLRETFQLLLQSAEVEQFVRVRGFVVNDPT
jgi:hypothetical protein